MKVNEPKIDLLRYRQEEARESQNNMRFMLMLALIVLLFVGAMGGIGAMQKQQLQQLEAHNNQLQAQVNELTSLMVSTETDNKLSLEKFNVRNRLLEALEKQIIIKSKNIEEIYLVSAPNVTISRMDVKLDNSFTITAYCSSQTVLINYLQQVMDLDFVQEIKSVTSNRNAQTGEITFNLNLIWKEAE